MTQQLSKETVDALTAIAALPEAQLQAIVSKLESIPAKLYQRDDISTAVECGDLSAQGSAEISSTLAQLYWGLIQSRISVDAFAAELVGSPDLAIDQEKIPTLRNYLTRLLGVRSLFVGQNALSLLYDEEKIFAAVRVITNVRPVFGLKVDDGPAATILTHTLKLEYQTVDGAGEFFVALTLDDIDSLRNALQRAKDKDANLRTVYKTPFLS